MGWSFMHRDEKDTRKFFQQEFSSIEIIESCVKLGTAYFACKVPTTGEVFGLVCLTRWRHNDYFNFGYKDMDESMGPGCCDCPEKILKLLTPTESKWANEWRERCWARINARKQNPRPKMKVGLTLISSVPVGFRNGDKLSEFVVISTKPLRFGSPNNPYNRYRISKRIIDTLKVKEVA